MQVNILNKLKKIVVSFIAIILTMQSICFADFTDAQKQEIIDYANEIKKLNTAYSQRWAELNAGYELRETYGTAHDGSEGTYIFSCCATWVSTILNQKFGIEVGGNRNATDGYAMLDGWINPLFGEVTDEWQVGDIFLWWQDSKYPDCYAHVGMYLGKIEGVDYVTDCTNRSYPQYGNGRNEHGGIYVRPNPDTPLLVIRYGADVNSTGKKVPDDLTPALDKIKSNWIYRKVPFRQVDETSINKDQKFEYQGIGKVESKTTSEKEENGVWSAIQWAFAKISELIEWILNFILTVIKGIFVGLGTLIQITVSQYIEAASGTTSPYMKNLFKDGMMAYYGSSSLKEQLARSITLEKIVYNQVPLFDTDVFNGNIAG